MSLEELVDVVSGKSGRELTEPERNNLIRMLERAVVRGADVDQLIEECKAFLA